MLESLQHVIDSSAANVDEQREAVLDVLKGIGVPKAKLESCMVEAWNKVLHKPSPM
jgi:50S ribosomal subunit-associated GTPase HflX